MDRSDEPPERSRAARRASKTRQRLLDAALTVINARGFGGCTIEDITESADVGKGTFYRHFPDKPGILQELLGIAAEDILTRIQNRRTQITSLESAASVIVCAHSESYASRPDLFLLFLQGQNMAAMRPAAHPSLAQPLARYFTALDEFIAPYVPPGDEAKRRRLTCAVAASVCGFIACARTGIQNDQDVTASQEPIRQALLAGLSCWLK